MLGIASYDKGVRVRIEELSPGVLRRPNIVFNIEHPGIENIINGLITVGLIAEPGIYTISFEGRAGYAFQVNVRKDTE